MREYQGSTFDGDAEYDRRFILAHFTQIKRRAGFERRPELVGQITTDSDGAITEVVFYDCDRYEHATGRCLAYEERPSFCRSYPWGSTGPRRNAALPAACAFNADIGRPVVWAERK
jgi:Fe-S-cluster containining protein